MWQHKAAAVTTTAGSVVAVGVTETVSEVVIAVVTAAVVTTAGATGVQAGVATIARVVATAEI